MSDGPTTLAGRMLSHYEVQEKLGAGGMGEVYRARDTLLNRTVALKILPTSLASEEDRLRRFLREARAASSISHANVAHIYEVGDSGGIHFIAMEYVVGRTLGEILREGPLPPARVIDVARQIAEALEEAHARRVVHRDIKPGNVMVTERGQVKVLDFGVAKMVPEAGRGDAGELFTLTKTASGVVLGTLPYMSPEQALGMPVDARSDLFSLGIVLYELAAGRRPFRADGRAALLDQILRHDPPRPSNVNPATPSALDRIVVKCLRKRPDDRYQSAKELLEDLRRLPPGAPAWMTTSRSITAGSIVLAAALSALALRSCGVHLAGTTAENPVTSLSPPTSQEARFLAVLPFRALGGDQRSRLVAEGVVEALSSRLFQLGALRVVSSRDVEQAKEARSIEKAARTLGANLIVEGTVQSAGNRVRLVVNLHDLTAKRQTWTRQFTGTYEDLFTLQDEIYDGLVRGLAISPGNESPARSARPTDDVAAYDLYLKGRDALRSGHDPARLRAAVGFFEQAIKTDGGFALAYTGLADASLMMYQQKKDRFWAERARAAALRARDLDTRLPEAQYALGSVYSETGEYAEAVVTLKRALELAPNADEAHRRLGNAYLGLGKRSEALEDLRKAVEVSSYFWLNHNALGEAYLAFNETGKALEEFRRVTELEPENPVGYNNIGSVYFAQGRWEDSIPAYERSLALQPDWLTNSNLGTAYFFLRRYPEAVRAFEQAVALNPNDAITVGNLADGLRWSGQRDRALATYQKAIALGYKELQVNPRGATTLAMLALYQAKSGNPQRAAELMRRARSIDPKSAALLYYEAVVHTLGNRVQPAIVALEKALAGGYSAREAAEDPELEALAKSPDFIRLMSRYSERSK